MMKISLVIEAVNRATGPLRSIMASLRGLTSATRAASGLTTGIAGIGRAARGSAFRVFDFTRDAGYHFRTLAGPQGIASATRSMSYLRSQVSGLTGGLSILKYAAGAAIVGLGEEFVRGVFKAGDETRSMLVTLSRLEGGAANARRSMAWMQNFGMGAGSQFSMPDIFAGYKMAANFGFDPQKNLGPFADLAAGETKSLFTVLRAVQDATAGTSMKPLKNLGIDITQGKGKDGTNTYEWDVNKVHHTMTSAKGRAPVLNAILQIIDMKYGGIASGKAGLFGGQLQALKNKLFAFQVTVANAGVYDWATGQLHRFFDYLDRASKDGSLQRLAKTISDNLIGAGNKLIRFFMKTDWASVGRDLKVLAGSLMAVAYAIGFIAKLGGGGLSGLFNLYLAFKIYGITRALVGLVPAIRAASTVLWGLGRAAVALFIGADPVAWVIAGLVAAALLIWKYWNPIKAFFLALPARIVSAWQGVKTFFSTWQPPSWLKLVTGVAMIGSGNFAGAAAALAPPSTPKAAPARLLPGSRVAAAAAALSRGPQPGQGDLTIRFDNAPAGMRVTGIKPAPGQTINVKRGPITPGSR